MPLVRRLPPSPPIPFEWAIAHANAIHYETNVGGQNLLRVVFYGHPDLENVYLVDDDDECLLVSSTGGVDPLA